MLRVVPCGRRADQPAITPRGRPGLVATGPRDDHMTAASSRHARRGVGGRETAAVDRALLSPDASSSRP